MSELAARRANEPAHPRDIDEVNILEGYLNYVLETFDLYCSELNKAIGTGSPTNLPQGAAGR